MAGNPKHEFRNPKQRQMIEIQNRTGSPTAFGSFEFWICFEIRNSDFEFLYKGLWV